LVFNISLREEKNAVSSLDWSLLHSPIMTFNISLRIGRKDPTSYPLSTERIEKEYLIFYP
jgi:alpha-D-ribose 1-methylphosphonate 5-triphosphate diphosphatase PhnM